MNLAYLKKILIIIIIIGAVFLSASGYIDKFPNILGMGSISDSNDRYLKNSFNKAVNGFLILSGIKSGLAVIEGSEVGIGFNLELGDVVQSVYDYVDIAWKTALAGGTVILLTRLMLKSVKLIDHWFLFLMFMALFSSLMLNWFFPKYFKIARTLKEATYFLMLFSIALYILLPFSITGAAFLSEKITKPLIQESQNSFESIQEDFSLDAITNKLFPDEQEGNGSWISELNLKAKYEKTKHRIKELSLYFKEKTRNIAIWTIQLIAGYLFDSIIFPVAFFIILFVITKSILVYLFENRRYQSFKEDIESMVIKYYSSSEKSATKPYRQIPIRDPRKPLGRNRLG
ncbi:MAG: hypothetical protein HKO79_10330 [Desulfobacterales bacterium]|nr:hypothetical protein [Deltaproteobacteria bacterium]NNL42877.1 hypothetical protein [Desulfobacterales bacterium]